MAQTVAGHSLPIAVGGKNWLLYTGAGEVVVKDGIYQIIDVFKDIASVNPLLVIGGGGGNGKVVALISVQRDQWF